MCKVSLKIGMHNALFWTLHSLSYKWCPKRFFFFGVKLFLCTHSVWACSKLTDSPDFCLPARTESISIKAECAEPFIESPETECQGCCGPIHLHCQLDKSDVTGLLAYSHVKQSNSLCLLHHPSKCQLCHVALMKRVNSSPTLPLVFRDLLFM